MEFGERLRELRFKQGLTLEAVGRIVGVGKSTVKKWESGAIASVKCDKIALLAKALHTTPAHLMGWESDELSPEERKLLDAYRNMDGLGRRAVDQLASAELKRCAPPDGPSPCT